MKFVPDLRHGMALILLACLVPQPVVAGQQRYLETLIEKAEAQGLADDPHWRRLLYYTPARTPSGWRSDADNEAFFISADGRDDPLTELQASLAALFEPALSAERVATGDQHPQCAFIARHHWLRERLEIDEDRLPFQPCPRFDTWFEAIDPARVALVFADDYVGNPSSAFGHTLLRLDRPAEDASRLVSYAVNYAAIVGDANPVSYAWRGLTGGYPGYFSLLPYYDKVKEYNDLESRDMWEYELALTPDEIRRMMMHLWEVGSVPFDYYFLRENCSFRLLGLLEVARPGLTLTRHFRYWAIPTDTVRIALEQEGLLQEVTWRASAERRLKHSIALASAEVRRTARQLATDGQGPQNGLLPEQQAHALELAHDWLHFRYLDGSLSRDEAAPRLHRLLVERSRVDVEGSLPAATPPTTRPDQGHATARAGLGSGYADGEWFTELQWRAAYHDLADPWPGYRQGTQIDFLGAYARYEHDRNRLRLERLDVVEIWSLAPRNAFLKPVSWKVGGGLMRDPLLAADRPLTGEFHGGAGLAWSIDRRERLIGYGLLEGQAVASRHIDDRVRLGAGPRLGLVLGSRYTALHASAVARAYSDVSQTRIEARLEQSLSLGERLALRLRLDYAAEGGRYYRERTLIAHWYF